MALPSVLLRNVARQLLAVEAAKSGSLSRGHAAVNVCERLRVSLTRLAGPDAYTSLLRRALTLARAEAPVLGSIDVAANGSLTGLEELAARLQSSPGDEDEVAKAAATIITKLLELLVTFVGRSLTLRLVRDACPDLPLDDLQ